MTNFNKISFDVLSNISFKTQGYRKNFDLITKNENIITEYTGDISMLRLSQHKPPIIVGEYSFSVWDISLAKLLNINLNNLLNLHKAINAYNEFGKIIKNKNFDANTYDKVVIIHSLVIHEDYRKLGVTEEFIEFLYRDYHFGNAIILAQVQPFQDNKFDLDYYTNQKTIMINSEFNIPNSVNVDIVLAAEYYKLKKFIDMSDTEINEYKLFALAKKCGFERINESYLFILNPEVVIERIKEKKRTENHDNLLEEFEIS